MDRDGKWLTNGKAALTHIAETSPTAYVKLMVDIQPKNVTVEAGQTLADLLMKVEEEDREVIDITPDVDEDTDLARLPSQICN